MTTQVSAEVAAICLDQPFELKKVQKSTDAEEGIRTAMQHCFLFAGTLHLAFLSADRQAACPRTVQESATQGVLLFDKSCSKPLAGLQTWKKSREMMLCTPCSRELWCLVRC